MKEDNKEKIILTPETMDEMISRLHNPQDKARVALNIILDLFEGDNKMHTGNRYIIDKKSAIYSGGIIIDQIQKLEDTARRDCLTGLLNRTGFEENAKKAIKKLERYQNEQRESEKNINFEIAVVFADINHLKEFNDSYGHTPNGDKLLKCIAESTRKHTRETDLHARYGGDEFLILHDEFKKYDTLDVHIKCLRNLNIRINEDIQNCIKNVLKINGNTSKFSISLGLSILGRDANNLDELIEHADIAMYSVKHKPDKEGLNYRIYDLD